MRVKEIFVKGIIVKSNLPDTDYVVNPYVGCQHGCKYCYAEFMKKYTSHKEDEWGTFVDVKINATSLLKNKEKYKGKRILFSSVTDPYQPLEAKYRLTRNILENLVDVQPEIEILTKSRLVLRDIDILKKFEKVIVGVSISTLNESYAKILEPNAALPHRRIDLLKRLNQEGISTYVFISPIFPYITELKEIIDITSPYVDYFMFENLNLRYYNKEKIYRIISQIKPELLQKYRNIYDNKNYEYWHHLKREIMAYVSRYDKEARVYFHFPKRRM